jgi:hypothetical protein
LPAQLPVPLHHPTDNAFRLIALPDGALFIQKNEFKENALGLHLISDERFKVVTATSDKKQPKTRRADEDVAMRILYDALDTQTQA